ncbi:hypothetical protein GQ53DRAFT_838468 [Thozetella sp. PMI_491]|nr:hypothetical protein GQ53DRAFT_838468 [Thozetella sp. PMI_491]
MESREVPCPSLTVFNGSWDQVFATPRHLNYSIEDRPYVKTLRGYNISGPAIQAFILGSRVPERFRSELQRIESFSGDLSLQTLERLDGCRRTNEQPRALLDDRSNVGGPSCSRKYLGPLTTVGLYKELSKKRFSVCRNPEQKYLARPTNSSQHAGTDGVADPAEPDADRRLIFITDPDCWSVLVLVATASPHQAKSLRHMIHKYLSFKASFGVSIPSTGLMVFYMEFHLPYYALRTSYSPIASPAVDERGLRRASPLLFASPRKNGGTLEQGTEYLYEAQATCVITGTDHCRWVGYCFVETYFDKDEDKESVQSYHQDAIDGMRLDPFTLGKNDANMPIKTPRDYFVRVFEVRASQVKEEWTNVVERLDARISEYMDGYNLPSIEERFMPYQKSIAARDWIVNSRKVLGKLSESLCVTLTAWDNSNWNTSDFLSDLRPSASRSCLAITASFNELRTLQKTLQHLLVRVNDFSKSLELQFLLEGNRVSASEQKNSVYRNDLSTLTAVFSPIALAASLFSMRPEVLPLPPDPGTFLIVILFLASFTTVILTVFRVKAWLWHVYPANGDMKARLVAIRDQLYGVIQCGTGLASGRDAD